MPEGLEAFGKMGAERSERHPRSGVLPAAGAGAGGRSPWERWPLAGLVEAARPAEGADVERPKHVQRTKCRLRRVHKMAGLETGAPRNAPAPYFVPPWRRSSTGGNPVSRRHDALKCSAVPKPVRSAISTMLSVLLVSNCCAFCIRSCST